MDGVDPGRPCALAPSQQGTQRALGICDAAVVGFVFFTLVHASQVLGSDQAQAGGESQRAGAARQPMSVSSWMMSVPDPFRAVDAPATASDPASEFRPRRRPTPQQDTPSGSADDQSIMRSTSVWDRLAEARSAAGVQLVTLWQTGGNSLSLQAGRKGDPTIQWTSRLMSRSNASHGLLDDLFSSAVRGTSGRGLPSLSHPANFEPSSRPGRPADSASVPAAAER